MVIGNIRHQNVVIGNMRHQIVIEQVTKTKDIYGADTDTWATYLTLKAEKKDMSGTQLINNMEVFNSKTIDFHTHFREGIDIDDMRVCYRTEYYRILSVIEVEYRKSMIIRVEKIND